MSADYLSFDDVLDALQLKPDELKRMVSSGELRAFRDQNEMKFKAEDVEVLKAGRQTDPTIILPSDEIDTGEVGDELDFGAAPAIDAAQTATEEIVFEETDFEIGDDTGEEALSTQELDASQVFEEEEEYEAESPVQFQDEVAYAAPAAGGAMPMYAMPTVVQAEEGYTSPVWIVLMVVILIVMLFTGWGLLLGAKVDSDNVKFNLIPGDDTSDPLEISIDDTASFNLPAKKDGEFSDPFMSVGNGTKGLFGFEDKKPGQGDPFDGLLEEE